jgi:L-asparagine oxygenase
MNVTTRAVRQQGINRSPATVAEFIVSRRNSRRIAKKLKAAIACDRYSMDRDARDVMAIAADIIAEALSPDDLARLRAFGAGQGPSVVIVDGLPTMADLPPTPFRGFGDDTQVIEADAQLLGIYQLMGISPVANRCENNGFLWRNVVPDPDETGVQSSHGYNTPLDWHSDDSCGSFEQLVSVAGSKLRSPIPQFLGFVSLRNQDRDGRPIPTEVLSNDAVLRRLSNERALAVLCEGEFRINPPASNNGNLPLENVPLIVRYNGTDLVRFSGNSQQVTGMTAQARWALEQFEAAISAAEDDVIAVNLEPGRVMVFNNYRVLHKRKQFDPGDDWKRARWLRRCFGCQCLYKGIRVDPVRWPFLWG